MSMVEHFNECKGASLTDCDVILRQLFSNSNNISSRPLRFVFRFSSHQGEGDSSLGVAPAHPRRLDSDFRQMFCLRLLSISRHSAVSRNFKSRLKQRAKNDRLQYTAKRASHHQLNATLVVLNALLTFLHARPSPFIVIRRSHGFREYIFRAERPRHVSGPRCRALTVL
jgi:hypothetical protein